MKQNWIYPLMIVIASSSYGILSTIVKVAMQHGFTSAEAITSQYLFCFFLAKRLVFLCYPSKLFLFFCYTKPNFDQQFFYLL